MFCKWCGMESMTTDQCSWCHHSLTTTAVEESPSRVEAQTPEEVFAPAAFAASEPEIYEEQEESPLAAGLTAPKDQPKPNAAVPPPPIAPLPATAAQEIASRPAIGVRRSGGAGGTGGRSIPAVPPPRPASAGGNRAGSHTPPPAMPMSPRSSTPVPHPTAATASANTATLPPPAAPAVRPPEVSASRTGRLTVPAALMGGARAAVPEMVAAPAAQSAAPSARMGQPVVEGEAGGLADGFSAPSRAPENANVPQLGTFTPAKSKYYSGQILDPVSGTHYDADTGKPTTATSAETTPGKKDTVVLNWDTPETEVSMAAVVGKFLGIFGVILLVSAIFAAIVPSAMLAPLLIANFAGGLLLPVLGVVPWQDEDSDDAIPMFLLLLMFGPVVALIIYGVITLVRQTGNAAVVGVLAVGALSNIVIRFAAHGLHRFSDLMPFQSNSYSVALMFLSWTGLLAVAGWFFANVFHKFDE